MVGCGPAVSGSNPDAYSLTHSRPDAAGVVKITVTGRSELTLQSARRTGDRKRKCAGVHLGDIAQLGEQYLCKVQVKSSSLFISTPIDILAKTGCWTTVF